MPTQRTFQPCLSVTHVLKTVLSFPNTIHWQVFLLSLEHNKEKATWTDKAKYHQEWPKPTQTAIRPTPQMNQARRDRTSGMHCVIKLNDILQNTSRQSSPARKPPVAGALFSVLLTCWSMGQALCLLGGLEPDYPVPAVSVSCLASAHIPAMCQVAVAYVSWGLA